MLDAEALAVLLELTGVELATPVRSERAQLAPPFCLSHSLHLLETLKCLIFRAKKLQPHIPIVIIYNQ